MKKYIGGGKKYNMLSIELTLGSLHLSEGITYPRDVTSTFKIKQEGRKRWASHRASGSDSNDTLRQPMLAWAANKWGLGINPVMSHSVSTLFFHCLSEGGIAGGSGPPVLPHWAHLGVCVYFCCSTPTEAMFLHFPEVGVGAAVDVLTH